MSEMYIVTTFMFKGVAVFITDTGYIWVAYNRGGEMRFACVRNFHEIEQFV